jgi:signal transduction histidine kinase
MFRRRSTILFLVLVALPLALLVWLGTYLMRDAAKRTDASMQAILAERLSSADHQLVHDLRQLTDQLDGEGASASSGEGAAQVFATHRWVARAWYAAAPQPKSAAPMVKAFSGPANFEPVKEASPQTRSAAIFDAVGGLTPLHADTIRASVAGGPPFQRLMLGSQAQQQGWQTHIKLPGYHFLEPLGMAGNKRSFLSGWHVSEMTFIYWQRTAEGGLACAVLNTPVMLEALFRRLPQPGLEVPPGRMQLITLSKSITLHQWGKRLAGSEATPAAHRACSEPLSQWSLAYTPADEEFPKPYLFPIILGIGSGVLLVFVVGWLYFHESARELQVAQQRVTFVNQVSHELKTPLTNIRLYAEMAAARAESSGDIAMKRQLAVVETEASRLDRLIQNVLNYARQQRDKLTISAKPVALDDLVTRGVEFWRPLLEKKGFEIAVELNGPPILMADPDAISQIIGNLLSNVEKYAANGRYVAIRTEVEPAESASKPAKARILIEDRGPGIPTGKRRAIFEPFERLRSDLTEGVSGTGIGLTISRELAQLHGGKLSVCSQYREGSRFILTLPIRTS